MNALPYKLLIVDDEPSIRKLLSDYFASLEYNVRTAENAEEAMKLITTNEVLDLIISDIDMPGMSGIDLLRFSRETRPDVPVVMITGLKTLEYAISAVKYGAQDYITKPFELGNVRKVVEKVLRYRKSTKKQSQLFEYAQSMTVNFDIPTDEIDAGITSNYVAQILLNSGFCQQEEYHQFYVAIMETIINAIEHGNLELPSSMKGTDFEQIMHFEELREKRINDPAFGKRNVGVYFQLNSERFSLTITDNGPGFDWKSFIADDSQLFDADTKPHGRGFMLIRHIIDEVYFNAKGNSITLLKSKSDEDTNF
ncbi:MAG: response regulator [Calditrichia bacterium]